jgi:hypothetical protein
MCPTMAVGLSVEVTPVILSIYRVHARTDWTISPYNIPSSARVSDIVHHLNTKKCGRII